ncbi:MAG: hypothetical protein PSV16_09350 [Flavobacterium sp.]|nr:hypothetical protein [Flavobacterium sp.]
MRYPQKTLNFDLIKEMVNKYRDNQLQSILDSVVRPMHEDAEAIWFDLDTLKDFIADIENLVADNPNAPKGKLGLRMYYAAYPTKEKWSRPGYEDLADLLQDPVTQRYEKKHTLILVPTTEVEGENFDFNPIDENTAPGRTLALTGTANSPTMALNHAYLIPPNSAIGEWF